MRVLITGGAGFIGSHLCEALLAEGHHVDILDNLSTGRIENVAPFRDSPRFTCTIDSVFNEPLVAEMIGRVDVVFHLAAAVGVKLIVQDPVHTIETNVHGTEVVLRHAAPEKQLVFIASTSEVYGKSTHVPFREDADLVMGATTRHRWAYACSKALDEFLALAYWKQRQLPVIIVRFFNTVGPRQTGRYGMVLPRFARAALIGETIPVHGDGSQSRCFTHVADSVRAMLGLVDAAVAGDRSVVGGVFNIGSDAEVSMLDLAERVRTAAESPSPIELVPYEAAYGTGFEDMRRRTPDLSRIRGAIGWAPQRDLAAIIRDVLADQRARLARGD